MQVGKSEERECEGCAGRSERSRDKGLRTAKYTFGMHL